MDPIPFTLNKKTFTFVDCNTMPYTWKFEKVLYFCTMRISATETISVNPRNEAVNMEYAISFRVEKWVDHKKKVLVVPMSSNNSFNIFEEADNVILINEETIAVFVVSPSSYERSHTGPRTSFEVFWTAQEFRQCPLYQEDLKCRQNTKFSFFAGSDPGLAKYNAYHLADVTYTTVAAYDLRISVFTILVNQSCAFCAVYSQRDDVDFDPLFLNYDCADDSNCYILAEISVNCYIEDLETCAYGIFSFNGIPIEFDQCTAKYTSSNGFAISMCHGKVHGSGYVIVEDVAYALQSSISFRASEWIVNNIVYKRAQHICRGTTMITSRGFQNPFEYPNLYQNPSYPGQIHYNLTQNITCESFKVDITVEVLFSFNGNLMITFRGESNEKREIQSTVSSTNQPSSFPYNESRSNIDGVQVFWMPNSSPIDLKTGFFLRVHVDKSA
ncbi:unnamed protein product, partial [Mesorhabditis belari]|uniref:Uncharacterized protein n=1 Tax=Mesorhabditis belari TaxID=2138241 RepID=A0AAF3EC09_9BILA